MKGNFPVRFRGGLGRVTAQAYPVPRVQLPQAQRLTLVLRRGGQRRSAWNPDGIPLLHAALSLDDVPRKFRRQNQCSC
jgi:hypothetical protein